MKKVKEEKEKVKTNHIGIQPIKIRIKPILDSKI